MIFINLFNEKKNGYAQAKRFYTDRTSCSHSHHSASIVDPNAWPKDDNLPPDVGDRTPVIGGHEMRTLCVNRHSGAQFCLFADWSVRKVGLKELWTLKWHREFDTNGTWTIAGGAQPDNWPKWMRKFKDY